MARRDTNRRDQVNICVWYDLIAICMTNVSPFLSVHQIKYKFAKEYSIFLMAMARCQCPSLALSLLLALPFGLVYSRCCFGPLGVDGKETSTAKSGPKGISPTHTPYIHRIPSTRTHYRRTLYLTHPYRISHSLLPLSPPLNVLSW